MAVVTKFPTANEVETTGWTNPSNAHADDGVYATAGPAKNAAIGTSWKTFGFDGDIPAGSTIQAVKIIYEYNVSTTASIATMRVRARVNDVDEENHDDTSEPTTDTVITVDITADRAWTRADLLDAALKITGEARRGNSNNAVTFSLDQIKVEVTYDATQNISAAGAIASSEAFGSPQLNLNLSAAGGIATGEAVGSPTVSHSGGAQDITGAGAIASGEAFGAPQLNLNLGAAGGIASAEAFGIAQLNLSIQAAGDIGTAEALGSPQLNLGLSDAGAIASSEAFGSLAVSPGPVTVSTSAIGSGEAFGAPTISQPGAQSITGAGAIASSEAFGSLAVSPTVTVSPPEPSGPSVNRRARTREEAFYYPDRYY